MNIKKIVLGSFQTNCYIISNDNKQCIVIDPGTNGKKIAKYIEDNEFILDAILLTHGHFDHIGAVDYLYNKYQCEIYIHKEDISSLKDANLNLSTFETPFIINSPIHNALDLMDISGFNIEWLHLPGHCPGSSMIRFTKEEVIFSGDVLFQGSIGRFDFPLSSKHDTIQSLEKIKTYNFKATIYPGHGENTTLQDEILNNPYLKS